MNGQIVVCPGWNDGDQLRRTLRDLTEMAVFQLLSGAGGHHQVPPGPGEAPARGRRPPRAEIIDIADEYGRENLERFGTRRFFCADELYPAGGPSRCRRQDYYEGYRQLENGVGMLRSLEDDFLAAPWPQWTCLQRLSPFTIATGTAAAPFLPGPAAAGHGRTIPGLRGQVIAVENDFFGHTIDVAGLLTGQDLSAQLRGAPDLGDRVLIPHAHAAPRRDRVSGRLHRGASEPASWACPVQIVGDRRRRPAGRHARGGMTAASK